jgi:FkbM family methyltransferase
VKDTKVLKSLKRAARYNPATEFAKKMLRGPTVQFESIDLSITIEPGDIVIDCGANVGDVTAKFFRAGATVYAFEPNPKCFRVLRRRFLGFDSVKCRNQGVMDRATTLRLETPEPHKQFDALDTTVAATFVPGINTSADYQVSAVDVECIDLSRFVQSIGRVRFIKVDIEGSEIPVINSLLDTGAIANVDIVAVETHERFSPELAAGTEALRARIMREGLQDKIRLDWY